MLNPVEKNSERITKILVKQSKCYDWSSEESEETIPRNSNSKRGTTPVLL